jgi:hypothetical protein
VAWRLAKQWTLREARSGTDAVLPALTPALWARIEGFRPAVVYSCPSSTWLARWCCLIAGRLDIPIVPHFLDDFPATLYRRTLSAPMQRPLLLYWLRRLLTHTDTGLVISEEMRQAYEARYRRPFSVVRNGLADATFAALGNARETATGAEFAYFGSLDSGRARSMRTVIRAMLSVSTDLIQPTMVLYTGAVSPPAVSLQREFGERVVRLEPAPSDADLPRVARVTTAFIHVDSFEPEFRRYFRYSMSSKLSLYCASGRPVLAFGPREIPTNALVEREGVGISVSVAGDGELANAFARLLAAGPDVQAMSRRGRRLVALEFLASRQQECLRSVVEKVVGASERRSATRRVLGSPRVSRDGEG